MEECSASSGIREALAWEIQKLRPGIAVNGIDLGDHYVPHGNVLSLYEKYGLSGEKVAEKVMEVFQNEN